MSEQEKILRNLFENHYKQLANNGEKQKLHDIINESFYPPLALATIRNYCSNLNRIPESKSYMYIITFLRGLINYYDKESEEEEEKKEEIIKIINN